MSYIKGASIENKVYRQLKEYKEDDSHDSRTEEHCSLKLARITT